jgi:hypothetical protein
MTLPSDEDLGKVYDEAQYQAHVMHESGNVTGHRAGIAAVKRAVIEALAQEAEDRYMPPPELRHNDGYLEPGQHFVNWLRSHLEDV